MIRSMRDNLQLHLIEPTVVREEAIHLFLSAVLSCVSLCRRTLTVEKPRAISSMREMETETGVITESYLHQAHL